MSANDRDASGDRPAARPSQGSAVRRPTAWLAAAGVVVLLAAAFALSYDAFVALAREGGVNARLARYYPGVFDATMVVALAAIFVLRTARVYVRLLTWLSAFLVLAVCAGAGAVHAAEIHVPRQPLAAAVAVAPFLLLVLAFRLWLTMLRHIRRGAARRPHPEVTYSGYTEPDPEPHAASPLALLPATPSATEPGTPQAEPAHRPRTEPVRPAPEPAEPASPAVRTDPELAQPVRPEPADAGPAPWETPYADFLPGDPEAVEAEAPEGGGGEPGEPDAAERDHAEHSAGEPGERAELDDAPDRESPTIADVRDEQAPADEPREPTLDDLASAIEFADLGDAEASLEFDATALDESRPPLPRRHRVRHEAADSPIGEEDELVADDGPQSDPVSDEAEPVDEVAPADEADDVDEFAELEAEPEPRRGFDVPPPPSGRVRSSPLPPLDWGPGLGGLTGRRRTPHPQDESDTA